MRGPCCAGNSSTWAWPPNVTDAKLTIDQLPEWLEENAPDYEYRWGGMGPHSRSAYVYPHLWLPNGPTLP